jgi:hypothetical protein
VACKDKQCLQKATQAVNTMLREQHMRTQYTQRFKRHAALSTTLILKLVEALLWMQHVQSTAHNNYTANTVAAGYIDV